MKAWISVGTVCPTLRVPGMSLSGTLARALKSAVVGANDPMPSVSKKSVTAPTKISYPEGRSVPWLGARSDAVQRTAKATPTEASATRSASFAPMTWSHTAPPTPRPATEDDAAAGPRLLSSGHDLPRRRRRPGARSLRLRAGAAAQPGRLLVLRDGLLGHQR